MTTIRRASHVWRNSVVLCTSTAAERVIAGPSDFTSVGVEGLDWPQDLGGRLRIERWVALVGRIAPLGRDVVHIEASSATHEEGPHRVIREGVDPQDPPLTVREGGDWEVRITRSTPLWALGQFRCIAEVSQIHHLSLRAVHSASHLPALDQLTFWEAAR